MIKTFKVKHISDNIYNTSIKIMKEIVEIASKNSYKDIKTAENGNEFVAINLMFCFYFFDVKFQLECKYNEEDRNIILEYLIELMDYHLNLTNHKLASDAYSDIVRLIDEYSEMAAKDDIDQDPYIYISFLYLKLCFKLENTIPNTQERILCFKIAQQFRNIVHDKYKL